MEDKISHPLAISCYTDTLCIWAYLGQAHTDALHREFGDRLKIDQHFIPVFGDTEEKIVRGWEDRGGAAAYAAHVRRVAEQMGGVEVHPEIWVHNRPLSSVPAHLVLAAVRLLRDRGELEGLCGDDRGGRCAVEEAAWRIRVAFFRDLQDVSSMAVLEEIVGGLGIPRELLRGEIASGRAFAALAADTDAYCGLHLEGSPTFILDGGRQKLYGNLSVQVLRANVAALLGDA